jgi:hypothetical protein
MISHRAAADNLLDLVAVNEDETTDPNILIAWAQVHALLAVVDAITELKNDSSRR